MPIYEYRCSSCGYEKEYLQKMSDAPFTQCPECRQATFNKRISAAGFQLKGSGWYVTDFRGAKPKGEPKEESKGESKGESKPAESPSDKPATAAPA